MKKIKNKIKKIIQFIANPRLLLCFGIAWIITNGWSYALLGIGTYYNIGWMIAIASGYLTFLWLPISPEKIVTVAIAMVLLRFLFPNDQKTLGTLKEMSAKVKESIKRKREDRKVKKVSKITFQKHFLKNFQITYGYNEVTKSRKGDYNNV